MSNNPNSVVVWGGGPISLELTLDPPKTENPNTLLEILKTYNNPKHIPKPSANLVFLP